MHFTGLVIFVIATISMVGYAQDDYNFLSYHLCLTEKKPDPISVETFKNTVSLRVFVKTLTLDQENHLPYFSFKEDFENESSMIKINDSIALKFSLSRAVDYGFNKFNLSKRGRCWRELIKTTSREEFSLGNLTAVHSVGNKDATDSVTFSGSIKLT
jgi:hypothetical protein